MGAYGEGRGGEVLCRGGRGRTDDLGGLSDDGDDAESFRLAFCPEEGDAEWRERGGHEDREHPIC